MAIVRIEISDPVYEAENLRYLTIHSTHLKGRGDVTVFVPRDSEKSTDLPVVALLHGVYGSHWAWARQMNVHNVTQELINSGELPPMVLVMPCDGLWGDGTGYLPYSGYDFEKWIIEDMKEALIQKIPQISAKSSQFISGLSMGGYGALRLGSKYSNLYTAFSGHSSITQLEQMSLFVDEDINTYSDTPKEVSVFETMLKSKNNLSPFRFDCGQTDKLVEFNRELHGKLNSEGIEHIYEEYEGAHTFEYWKEHIVSSLKFFAQYL